MADAYNDENRVRCNCSSKNNDYKQKVERWLHNKRHFRSKSSPTNHNFGTNELSHLTPTPRTQAYDDLEISRPTRACSSVDCMNLLLLQQIEHKLDALELLVVKPKLSEPNVHRHRGNHREIHRERHREHNRNYCEYPSKHGRHRTEKPIKIVCNCDSPKQKKRPEDKHRNKQHHHKSKERSASFCPKTTTTANIQTSQVAISARGTQATYCPNMPSKGIQCRKKKSKKDKKGLVQNTIIMPGGYSGDNLPNENLDINNLQAVAVELSKQRQEILELKQMVAACLNILETSAEAIVSPTPKSSSMCRKKSAHYDPKTGRKKSRSCKSSRKRNAKKAESTDGTYYSTNSSGYSGSRAPPSTAQKQPKKSCYLFRLCKYCCVYT